MKTIVPRAEHPGHRELWRRIGRQVASGFIEAELIDRVGPWGVLGRFQDIVVQPGDMGDEGKAVGAIGLDGVGAYRRRYPCARWVFDGTVLPERMHRGTAALIVGREQVAAATVSGQKARGSGGAILPVRLRAPVAGSMRWLEISGTWRCPT